MIAASVRHVGETSYWWLCCVFVSLLSAHICEVPVWFWCDKEVDTQVDHPNAKSFECIVMPHVANRIKNLT